MLKVSLKFLLLSIFILNNSLTLFAQNVDFERFIKGFKKERLPYKFAPDTARKFKKSQAITSEEAGSLLKNVKNYRGSTPDYYSNLIEPIEPDTSYDGRLFMYKTDAYKVALLKKTDDCVVFLVCLRFIEQGIDYMKGEQYILYSFKPNGTPISLVPVAQRIQFDYHYNQVSSVMDKEGNINTLVEVFTPSGNEKSEEKYQLTTYGDIIAIE